MNTKNILLGILIVIVFATGFLIGRFSSAGDTYVENTRSGEDTRNNTNSGSNTETSASSTNTDGTSVAGGVNLTDSQKKMLDTLGIDVNKVTPEMIACAETSLGASRTAEIKNGATPSFSEGVKLVACYK